MNMNKKNNQWLVAVVFLILGFLLTYQYQRRQEPVRTLTIEETELLLQEIATLEGEKEELLQKNRKLLLDVKNFETAAASSSEAHALLKQELDRSRLLLGMVDAKGPGIVMTLRPTDASLNPQTFNYLTDLELIYLVNELKFAGAEAISINDKRVTIQTGIQSSANNSYILVNDEKVSPRDEVVIRAVGDPEKLKGAMAFQGVLSYYALEFYDIRFHSEDHILIPKYNKAYRTDSMEEVRP